MPVHCICHSEPRERFHIDSYAFFEAAVILSLCSAVTWSLERRCPESVWLVVSSPVTLVCVRYPKLSNPLVPKNPLSSLGPISSESASSSAVALERLLAAVVTFLSPWPNKAP